MTIVIECVQRGGKIIPLDQQKIAKWKAKHKDGSVCDMILDDRSSSASSPLARKYFATRDEYAAINGYSAEYAHTELKALFGTQSSPNAIPVGRTGKVIEYHGRAIWLLSIRDYSHEELQRLVDRAEVAVAEASV